MAGGAEELKPQDRRSETEEGEEAEPERGGQTLGPHWRRGCGTGNLGCADSRTCIARARDQRARDQRRPFCMAPCGVARHGEIGGGKHPPNFHHAMLAAGWVPISRP